MLRMALGFTIYVSYIQSTEISYKDKGIYKGAKLHLSLSCSNYFYQYMSAAIQVTMSNQCLSIADNK